jgi:hypothetical protein
MALIAWIKNPDAIKLVCWGYRMRISFEIAHETPTSVFVKQSAKNQTRFFVFIH